MRMPRIAALHLLTILLATSVLAGPINAEGLHPYANPVPLGDYVEDIDELLFRALNHDHWTLTKRSDADYAGEISYKGFDIQVGLTLRNDLLTMSLESVTATGCTSNCTDLGEEPVLHWLVTLRRAIAYELTLLVLDRYSSVRSSNQTNQPNTPPVRSP